MREKLKQRRLELGFTQEEIAKQANIDRSTYTNIELGHKNPSFALALKLKKILKTTDDNIFLVTECQKGTKQVAS